MTLSRDSALNDIIRLAAAHDISIDEIAARMNHAPVPGKDHGRIGKLFNYIGGIFVFSGLCVLIGMIWDDIGSLQRVIITFGAGLSAFALGIAALKDSRFEKAATPLFLVSAFLQPTGLFVFLNEYMPRPGDAMLAATLIFGMLAVQQGLAFLKYRRASLLFFTLFFWNAFIGTAMDWMNMHGELICVIMGVSMLSLSWAVGKTMHRAITPFWYLVGGVTLLGAWWSWFEETPLDLSFLGVNALLVYVSIAAGSRTLLFVSVLGLLGYLGYFADEYFADVVGWPVCLIVLGFVMMGLSAYAVKLGRKIKRDAETAG
jgi:hypothetical protein